MERIASVLTKHRIIGIDTPVFIYHFERHPLYHPLTQSILSSVARGDLMAVTSVLTIMEITVQPLRLHRPEVADEYEVLLLNFPNLMVCNITASIVRLAASLRARLRYEPADALQVATCLDAEATLFITNDRQLRSTPDVEVLYLNDVATAT